MLKGRKSVTPHEENASLVCLLVLSLVNKTASCDIMAVESEKKFETAYVSKDALLTFIILGFMRKYPVYV